MFLLVPLFIKSLGGSEVTIGLVLGVGTAASVITRPLVGVCLDRFGRRAVLLWSAALNALSYLPFLVLRELGGALFLWTAIHEVMWGALFAAYFTYAADLAPAARRAEGIAIFGVAGMLTNGLGPALGEEILRRSTYTVFFLVAIGFALASLAITTLVPAGVRPRTTTEVVPRGGAREVLRTIARGGLGPLLAASVLFGAGINAAFFFVAPFTRVLGLERAAPFFGAYATTSVAIRILGRRGLDRGGPHRVAVPAFLVFASGLAGLAALPRPGVLVLAGIAAGGGHGALFPVLNALALERTPARVHGTVVSLYTAALDLGGVIGIPLCGALAETHGYPTMFVAMGLAAVAGFVLMVTDPARVAS